MNHRLRKILYDPSLQHFEMFDRSFTVMPLEHGWNAVICRQTLSPTAEEDAPDFWRRTLVPLLDVNALKVSNRILKYSDKGLVCQIDIRSHGDASVPVLLKYSNPQKLLPRWGTLLQGPKEWREFWLGHQLRNLKVQTPLPLACLWRQDRKPRQLRGGILVEFVSDGYALDQAIRILRGESQNLTRPDYAKISLSVTNTLAQLGRCGYWHRDLKCSNLVMTHIRTDPVCWLIDLDGVQKVRVAWGPGMMRSLARLCESLLESYPLTRTDRLRTLLQWIRHSDDPERSWKDVWARVDRRFTLRRRSRKTTNKLSDFQ